MLRALWLPVVALLFVPATAHALQLHWSSGADTLTFTEATRAILVLQADSAVVTLPPEWRLFVVTGFLGGLTTFSTFSAESVGMMLRGDYGWAALHAAGHLLGSLVLTALGIASWRALA